MTFDRPADALVDLPDGGATVVVVVGDESVAFDAEVNCVAEPDWVEDPLSEPADPPEFESAPGEVLLLAGAGAHG